jgi:hypothetical protein
MNAAQRIGESGLRGASATAATGGDKERLRRNIVQLTISIDIRHVYYAQAGEADGVCPDLEIWPTARTAARLAPLGLHWRRRADGGDIFGPKSLSDAFNARLSKLPRAQLSAAELGPKLFGDPLMFALFIRHPHFVNITDLPSDLGDGRNVLCISNRSNRGPSPPSTAPSPSEPAEGGLGGAVGLILPNPDKVIPVRAATFLAEQREHAHFRSTGEELKIPDWIPAWVRNREAEHFVREAIGHLTRWKKRTLPFAFLEIYPYHPTDDIGSGRYSLFPAILEPAADGGVEELGYRPVRYRVQFDSRKTRWRYVIADRDGRFCTDKFAVAGAGKEFAFEEAGRPDVPGAKSSFAFESKEAIKLRRQAAQHFHLLGSLREQPGREQRLIDPLPVPAAHELPLRDGRPEREGRISEMFVFV